MNDERPISTAFNAIVELALALNMKSIKDLPSCWEHQVDEHWFIAVNGHHTEQRTSGGASVPPFHAWVEFNGWPAGLLSPYEGIIAAGSLANEETFIAALESAAAKTEVHQ